jgi:hypothetical protein
MAARRRTVRIKALRQDVLINGAGLGAITSDETQSGVTDVPASTVQVYVGVQPAAVVSAGRGACCDGLDPSYRIPQGIAAWDVIRFTAPEGVTGCFIPVVVQVGTFVSNLAPISIAPGGGACPPAVPAVATGALADKTGISLGALHLGRGSATTVRANGTVTTNKGDSGNATFVRYPDLPASLFAIEYRYPENVCQINGYPGPNGGAVVNGMEAPIVPLRSVSLDAGPPSPSTVRVEHVPYRGERREWCSIMPRRIWATPHPAIILTRAIIR